MEMQMECNETMSLKNKTRRVCDWNFSYRLERKLAPDAFRECFFAPVLYLSLATSATTWFIATPRGSSRHTFRTRYWQLTNVDAILRSISPGDFNACSNAQTRYLTKITLNNTDNFFPKFFLMLRLFPFDLNTHDGYYQLWRMFALRKDSFKCNLVFTSFYTFNWSDQSSLLDHGYLFTEFENQFFFQLRETSALINEIWYVKRFLFLRHFESIELIHN